MELYTIEHPFRTISFWVQPKAQTELEASGLLVYQQLHSEMWQLRQHWLRCFEALENLKKTFRIAEADCLEMVTECKRYGDAAGYAPDEYEHLLPEGQPLQLRPAHLEKLMDIFARSSKLYGKELAVVEALYNEAMAMNESFSAAFEQFYKTYFSPIINAWDEVQLDTVSFDDDEQGFLKGCSEVEKMGDLFVDEWNELSKEVTVVSLEVKKFDVHAGYLFRFIRSLTSGSGHSEMN